jgi:hypothetical protein
LELSDFDGWHADYSIAPGGVPAAEDDGMSILQGFTSSLPIQINVPPLWRLHPSRILTR